MGLWILGDLRIQQQKHIPFSHLAHQSYSRIDYFLLDRRILSTLNSVEYESMVISDHSPVVLRLCFPEHVPPHRAWRLNPCLLSEEDFVQYMSVNIDDFLETNLDSVASVGTVWEALKAYLRGLIISYSARAHRERSKRMNELVNTIKDIDQRILLRHRLTCIRSASHYRQNSTP